MPLSLYLLPRLVFLARRRDVGRMVSRRSCVDEQTRHVPGEKPAQAGDESDGPQGVKQRLEPGVKLFASGSLERGEDDSSTVERWKGQQIEHPERQGERGKRPEPGIQPG